jgi:hypothetical protein
MALIIEYAQPYWHAVNGLDWALAPSEVANLARLTRMRTVIARENMQVDFQFQYASADTDFSADYFVTADGQAASLAGQPLAARRAIRRRQHP